MKSLILSTATRVLAPVILLLSVFVFLRGHNAPGGGFVGGLLAATAFALIEKAEGLAAARKALRVRPEAIAAVGLGCALMSGLWGGLEYGHFLKGVWTLIYDATGLPVADPALRPRRLPRRPRQRHRHPLRARGMRRQRSRPGRLMEVLLALLTGILVAAGAYLMMSGKTLPYLFGLTMISNAANMLIFAAGRLTYGKPALVPQGAKTVSGASNALPRR